MLVDSPSIVNNTTTFVIFELEISIDTAKYTSAGCSGVTRMKHEALKCTHCSMLVANIFWAMTIDSSRSVSDVHVLAVIKS